MKKGVKTLLGIMLAEQFREECIEKYLWYPQKTEEEMKALRNEIESRDDVESVTMFYLEGFVHLDGYTHWKYALINRTQTFSRKGFVFYDDNIKKFCKEPKGFILFVKEVAPNTLY